MLCVKWFLKIAFSAALIGILLSRYPVSLDALAATLRSVNLVLLVIVLPLLWNQFVLSSLKWQLILRSHGIDLSLGALIRSYMIGNFFSTFLPSSYGGDFVRIADVARSTGRTFESAAAVALERLSGLAALTFVGAVASIYIAKAHGDPAFLKLAMLLFGVLLLLVMVFVPGVLSIARPIISMIPLEMLTKAYKKVDNVVIHYRRNTSLIIRIVLLSFAFQLMAYTIFYLYGRTLKMDLPYIYCLAFVPIVYLLEALPISVAGIGLREGGLIYFLGKLGLSPSEAISLSILVVSGRYLMILIGGILLMRRRHLRQVATPASSDSKTETANLPTGIRSSITGIKDPLRP